MNKYIRTPPRETESLRAVSFSFVSVFYLQYLPCTFQLLSHIMRNVWGGRDNELEIGWFITFISSAVIQIAKACIIWGGDQEDGNCTNSL